MGNFGHVRAFTASADGQEHYWRSKLEYRYAVYLGVLREAGHILAWVYEDEELAIEFQHGRHNNTRKYLPDFGVQNLDGEWEVHETKGYFPPIDYTKIKAYVNERDNPFVLIFAKKIYKAQKRRAERLLPHIEATGGRIIWEAEKDLFKPIKHVFEDLLFSTDEFDYE